MKKIFKKVLTYHLIQCILFIAPGKWCKRKLSLDDRSIFLKKKIEKRVKKHLTNDFKNVNIILVLEK